MTGRIERSIKINSEMKNKMKLKNKMNRIDIVSLKQTKAKLKSRKKILLPYKNIIYFP